MLKNILFLFLLIVTPLTHTPHTTCSTSWFSRPTKKQVLIGGGIGVAFISALLYFFWFSHTRASKLNRGNLNKGVTMRSSAVNRENHFVIEPSDDRDKLSIRFHNILSDISFLKTQEEKDLDIVEELLKSLSPSDYKPDSFKEHENLIDTKLQSIGYIHDNSFFELGSSIKTLTGKTYQKPLDPKYNKFKIYVYDGNEYVKVSEIINVVRVLENNDITTDNTRVVAGGEGNSNFIEKKYFFNDSNINNRQLRQIQLLSKKQESRI